MDEDNGGGGRGGKGRGWDGNWVEGRFGGEKGETIVII